jgi:hypothetical protein
LLDYPWKRYRRDTDRALIALFEGANDDPLMKTDNKYGMIIKYQVMNDTLFYMTPFRSLFSKPSVSIATTEASNQCDCGKERFSLSFSPKVNKDGASPI